MIERFSPCKVNFLLNILGKRPDGFHELETLMHPVPLGDWLRFEKKQTGLALSCNLPDLPVDEHNLVNRAARLFLDRSGIQEGVRIHLEKRVPLAAGLGGGSSNAAQTLLALNQIFEGLLEEETLRQLAAQLGSDVPFFLQDNPALAFGRGEQIQTLTAFPNLSGTTIVLIQPGFGISTAWAYQQLAEFPQASQGTPGKARHLAEALRNEPLAVAGRQFYNALEFPALRKYPILTLYQRYLRQAGADVALMSGSGSATFGLFPIGTQIEQVLENFKSRFSERAWLAAARL